MTITSSAVQVLLGSCGVNTATRGGPPRDGGSGQLHDLVCSRRRSQTRAANACVELAGCPRRPPARSPTSCAAGRTQQLSALLDARPDLAAPAPHDSSQLAARVVVKASVLRALDALDTLELTVLQAIVQDTDPPHSGCAAEAVEQALGAAAHAGPRLGLARPAGPRRPRGAPAAGRPTGRRGRPAARSAWSLRRARSSTTSPRRGPTAAGAAPRGRPPTWWRRPARARGRTPRDGCPGRCASRCDERQVDGSTRLPTRPPPSAAQSLVDRAAAGAAFELVRRTELLLDRWGTHPPAALKAGGLGVRELRATADAAARRAGRGRAGHRDRRGGRAARPGHDRRRRRGLAAHRRLRRLAGRVAVADRWTVLARAWLASPRLVSAIGGRIGDKPVNALSPDLARAAGWSRCAATCCAELVRPRRPSDALAAGTGVAVPDRAAALAAAAPPAGPARPGGPAAGRGGPARDHRAGRAVLVRTAARRPARTPPTRWSGCCPRRSTTCCCRPTSPRSPPARSSRSWPASSSLVADVESRGGATVYRFAASSVRRAFDAGWSAAEVHDFVAVDLAHAGAAVAELPRRRRVPPVRHPARRARRVVPAQRRRDRADRAACTRPGAESLRLRRIAPTVVVSDVPLGTLLPRIRELGLAPVVEAVDGTVRVARPDVFRARSRRVVRRPARVPAPPPAPRPSSPRSGSATGRPPAARPAAPARRRPPT